MKSIKSLRSALRERFGDSDGLLVVKVRQL
jgi:hypothetical protein